MITASNFQGTFTPPKVGFKSEPIKIIGDGFCELTDVGLQIQGFKDLRWSIFDWIGAIFWILVSFIIGVFGFWLFFFAALGATLGLILRAKRKPRLGKPLEVLVPWHKVAYVKEDAQSNILIIGVKKFRYQRGYYHGELFFATDDARELLGELMERGVKSKPY